MARLDLRAVWIGVSMLIALSASACGRSDVLTESTGADADNVAVEPGTVQRATVEPSTAQPDITTRDTIEVSVDELDRSASAVTAAVITAPPKDASDGVMPDVLCMDLQQAQDLIQENGVFFSRSEDASGEGRRQLFDRNWIVVGQTPEPGASIGEGDAILDVLKDDEVQSCAG